MVRRRPPGTDCTPGGTTGNDGTCGGAELVVGLGAAGRRRRDERTVSRLLLLLCIPRKS